jgi:ribose-phosphate pyrophosphokinase
MKNLNLAYPENSEISFKISKFPDGQQSLEIDFPASARNSIRGSEVKISARLKTFRDLELIIGANQILREMEASKVHLYVPYFLGARSDRKFQESGVNYLKKVICPVINSQEFDSVTVLDPHSDVLEACLNNFKKVNNFSLVLNSLKDIDNKDGAKKRICLISPDGGALKKIYDVAENFQIPQIVTAMKHRDIKTGKITHTEVPNLPVSVKEEELKYVIVDDICDGGRTFIELSKAIKAQRSEAKIYLIVTHGIFSNSFLELSRHFTKIYSSNSYSDIDVEDHSDYTVSKDFLKQFNVF